MSRQTTIQAVLRHFDDATDHPFESLTYAVEGLTEADAFRQPAAYAAEEQEDGWPRPGTIAWQLAHLTHCKRHYTDCLRALDTDEPPAPRPWEPTDSLTELRSRLAAAHAEQRAAIAALTDADLARDATSSMSVAEFISMFTRHDIWHASQIAVARRLLRHES